MNTHFETHSTSSACSRLGLAEPLSNRVARASPVDQTAHGDGRLFGILLPPLSTVRCQL